MEESKANVLQSSRQKFGPLVPNKKFEELHLDASKLHVPNVAVVEPKVFSPFKSRQGHVPRPIEVERRKRKFAVVDITEQLRSDGVLEDITDTLKNPRDDSVRYMPLSLFDSTDYHSRTEVSWHSFVASATASGGIPARAMEIVNPGNVNTFKVEWRSCLVLESDTVNNKFRVFFCNDEFLEGAHDGTGSSSNYRVKPEELSDPLDPIWICFDAEDPALYCKRVVKAVELRKRTAATVALNLYVDCMPVDNLKPLDSEQVNRILENAINMDRLRQNSMLDTSSLLQQYNLNHMRAMNELILVSLLTHQQKSLGMVNAVSTDPALFVNPADVFPCRRFIDVGTDIPLVERMRTFKFSSLWNKMEAIQIIYHMQIEDIQLLKAAFYSVPEKPLRVEEFSSNQSNAASALTTLVKETWVSGITSSVRQNLKDVKKGWFNIEESNLEVYRFSKLRRFMCRINFMMEDCVRNLMYRMIGEYCTLIKSFCPQSITVNSNENVEVVGGRFPLFTVDLKFVNPTAEVPAQVYLLFNHRPAVRCDHDPLRAGLQTPQGHRQDRAPRDEEAVLGIRACHDRAAQRGRLGQGPAQRTGD